MRVLYAGPDTELVMVTSGEGRKQGVHLSDITKRMVYERDRKLNPESPIDAMVLERGFTWEVCLENALSARHKRPGFRPDQILEDGVWMSPDWVNPDAEIQHEEWKCTKKSLRQVTERGGFGQIGWTWIYNTQAYLRSLLRLKLAKTLATRFRVWFMNGDYSFESKTSDYHLLNDYWRFDVEFSKRELEENWRSIISHGQRYGILKGEAEWRKTETTKRPAVSLTRKPAGRMPVPERASGRIVTFPSTKRLSSRRSAS
jgi:hypothetical protein